MNLTEQVEIIQEPIDEKGKYNMKYLPDFQIDKATWWIVPRTPKANPSSSIRDWNKTVWKVDWFNTRIEQNEQNINLLAQDVSGNTAQINIQAGQISSIVADVDGNTSLIQQNSDAIELRVTTNDFNSQIAVTEWKIAMKTWDTDEVKAQVVVDAVNGWSVNIDWQRINITWNATFNSLQSQVNDIDNVANSKNTTYRQNTEPTWANVWDLWIDTWNWERIRRYNWSDWITTTTIIDWWQITTWIIDADRIFWTNIDISNRVTWWVFVWWEYYTTKNNDWNTTNWETIKLQYWKIDFLYDWDSSAYIKLDESLWSYLRILKWATSLIDRVRIWIEDESTTLKHPKIDIIASVDEYISILNTEYVDFNQADIKDVDDLYCDKLHTSIIYTNYMQVSWDNFQFNNCPMSIPNWWWNASDSMPSWDVTPWQMYLKHNSWYVASLWIYDWEDWGYINLNY